MSEKDGGGGHSHLFKKGVPHRGYMWCKLCKMWILESDKNEDCLGMTKEQRKRIREREKQQKELMDVKD